MKIYYIIILLFIPYTFTSYSQTNIVWYNQGIVNSSGNSNNQTTIYISGDIQFGNEDSNASVMTIEDSRIKLTGNLFNDVTRGLSGGNLFGLPTSGHEGIIEFCGTTPQSITTMGVDNLTIPSKLHNFINFPNLNINNSNHVTLDAQLAAQTKDIILSKGWLIVDSKTAKKGVDGGVEVNEGQESVLAHLLVDGNIDYQENLWSGKTPNERGFIQVNLKIPAESSLDAKSIVGFGIPFNEMRNDYFMFNTLLAPVPEGFLANPPLFNPETIMTAGKGYVVGIDLRGTDPSEYGPLEGYEDIDFTQRATDGYQFNRHAFALYAPNNQLFGNNPSIDAYQKEKLNTEDITINLTAGYNYLANPYTSPLNIDKLLGNDEAQTTWKIQSDVLAAKPQMRNQVWVLAPNSVAEPTGESRKSKYTYNYQVAMKAGGTYIDNDNVSGVTAIAPLQMFVIRAFSTANTITIPKKERVMGSTRFLRNSSQENLRRDDFIIEFRDRLTETTDRASIVLRTQEELNNHNNYINVERLESTSSESSNGTRTAVLKGDFEQSLASQIYTKDSSGKALTVQFLPLENTQRVILYHIPSSKAQPLHILGLRLDTKDKIERMWLEDNKYNTEVEITPNMLYETYSEPTDSYERFAIRFSQEGTGVDITDKESSHIYTYADLGNIFVEGFRDQDMGATIELFDVNGRLIIQKKIDDTKIILKENYVSGIYIIKAHIQEPRTLKLIAK